VRLANVAGRGTLLLGDGALDVAEASSGRLPADPQLLLERWDELRAWADAVDLTAAAPSPPAAALGPPSPRPRQVFAIGLNYRAHAAETGAAIPDEPVVFTKFPSCLTGPVTEVAVATAQLDWEAELGVVIGRTTRDVPVESAWDVVAGLTVAQDLSDRALQRSGPAPQWSLAKSLDGFGPTGPCLVTPDELTDPDDLELGCEVNGEVVQRSRTSDLIFPVPALLAYLSSRVTLYPGDLVLTGTPSGVALGRPDQPWLRPGDVLRSWVLGVGELRQSFVVPA
jgi:2,4-diketo-3-deoxy-L-fuconate hydrolase